VGVGEGFVEFGFVAVDEFYEVGEFADGARGEFGEEFVGLDGFPDAALVFLRSIPWRARRWWS